MRRGRHHWVEKLGNCVVPRSEQYRVSSQPSADPGETEIWRRRRWVRAALHENIQYSTSTSGMFFTSSYPDLFHFRLSERHSTPFQGNKPISSIPASAFAGLRRTHQCKIVDVVPWIRVCRFKSSRNEDKFPEPLSRPCHTSTNMSLLDIHGIYTHPWSRFCYSESPHAKR